MQYCNFSSDNSTLSNISNLLTTPQQELVFMKYLNEVKLTKHPCSFVDYYRSYIEKYNLDPDINMDMIELLERYQTCHKIMN